MPSRDDFGNLLDLAFFAGVPRSRGEAILKCSRTERFERRRALFRQGEPPTGLFLICKGAVKLTQIGSDGQETIMRVAVSGDVIAALAAFSRNQALPVSATALTEVRARFWERSLAIRLVDEHPGFAAALTREIGRQAQGLQLRLREIATEKVPRRLAKVLLRLAEQAGVDEDDGVRIDLPLTRLELAQLTGTTLYTVSRLLSTWSEAGIVRVGRSRVVIRSRRGLAQQATGRS
jgi:CRP-like cAMP-binding protein